MKRTILFSIASAGLLACSSPPSRTKVATGAKGADAITGDLPSDKGPGVDDYLGLQCGDKETHRGIRAWRRLSNIELQNTVDAVFGLREGIDYSSFVNDIPKAEVFDTAMIPSNFVNGNRLRGYLSFAESLAAKVDINKQFPCLGEGEVCIARQLPKVLASAWRRPATDAELQDLQATYSNLLRDGFTNEESARFLIQAIALSQNFLYRSELGEAKGSEFELTDWELASALSYATVRSIPDAELIRLAENGQLRDSAILRQQAERLLATPAARAAWKDFGSMWLMSDAVLEASKNQPEFNDDLKRKLAAETNNLFIESMFDAGDGGSFGRLLTADYTPADGSSDWIYNSTAADGKVRFNEEERRGILGQASFLASGAVTDTTNPVKRGVFIMNRLLCSGFPPAPPVEFPEVKPGQSTKEVFERHSQGSCAVCHGVIDQFGFAFENFNELGIFREKDGDKAIVIDAKVKIDGQVVAIRSPEEIGQAIANSDQGMNCFVRQTFRYALGRIEYAPVSILGAPAPEATDKQGQLDACQIQNATSAMKAQSGDMKTALLELISSPAFRFRLAGPKP